MTKTALTTILAMASAVGAATAQQATWTQLATTGPSARSNHALAFDSQRGRVVLFGGAVGGGGMLADTWEWTGTGWTQRVVSGPGARVGHGLAYDSQRGRTVLFGGSNGNSLGDTWEWDGTTWQARVTGFNPAPRVDPGLVYDSQRGRVVLFGGWLNTFGYFGDTWEWNGTAWAQVASFGPSARTARAMAYDSQRGRTVLFGGADNNTALHDTWEWNGTAWALRTNTGPSSRIDHALAYDSQRGRIVLFGGAFGSNLNDTWEWTGSAWLQQTTATTPTARVATALAYDSQRGRTLMFGGVGPGFLGDTWEYSAPIAAAFTTFGTGCAGANGTPTLAAAPASLPQLGATFTVRLGNLPITGFFTAAIPFLGFSNTSSGGAALPRDLAFVGMPGCTQYVDPYQTAFVFTASGGADWSIQVPNLPVFAGTRIHYQALVLDAPANAFGATVTNAGTATLGF